MRDHRKTLGRLRLSLRNRLLLVLIAALGATMLTSLWRKLDRAEDRRLQDETRITAEQVTQRLGAWIDFHIHALERVVDRKEPDFLESRGGFQHHAERVLEGEHGYLAINWVSPDGVIRTVNPLNEVNEKALGKDLDEHPESGVREAIARARAEGLLTRAPMVMLLQKERGFATYLPIQRDDGTLLGFVNGVFVARTLIDRCLAEDPLRTDFRWRLTEEDGTPAYEHGDAEDADAWPYAKTTTVMVVDKPWTLRLAPSPDHIAAVRTIADEIAYVSGLLATALLVFLLRGTLLGRESLRRSEALYRSLVTDVVDASRVGILILDRWHRVVWMNGTVEGYFGLEKGDVVGEDMRRVFRDLLARRAIDDPEPFTYRMFPSANAVVGSYECHVRAGDGREDRWLEHRSQRIREGLFAGGRIDHFYDITPRKKSDVERSRLIAAIEQGNDTVVITDPQGYTQYVNPAFERSTGYERLEIIGRRSGIPVQGPHDRAFYDELWATLGSGRTWQGRMKSVRRDGSVYEEVATISPIRDPSGRTVSFVAVKRDVSHEIELEAQLHQAQKMEAVGKLAGGVAHDFNNLLQVILGRSQILLARASEDSPDRESLKGIIDASERAAGLTRQLLAFGRRQLLERRVLDPNRLVSEHVRMLGRLLGEQVSLSVRLGENVGHVLSDRTQLEQVLMNLCVNARDAMPDGGKIVISTNDVVRELLDPKGGPAQQTERFAAVLVSDTGVGIEPENIDRVCEPFFSTKQPGQGSGLGLATVYGIIKQHGGQLEIESTPGEGTTFRILLPVTEETAAIVTDDGPQDTEQGSERILVVEDDPRVRALAVDVLAHAGYRVRTATDGEDALRVLDTSDEEVDLVFSDVVMPKMGGPALLAEVAKRNGDTRVLLTTGYAADSLGDEIQVEVLSKPYTPRAMLQKIRQVLDA